MRGSYIYVNNQQFIRYKPSRMLFADRLLFLTKSIRKNFWLKLFKYSIKSFKIIDNLFISMHLILSQNTY